MKTCASCGTEITKTAKTCPQCGAKNKKPIYKRGWFIALVIVVVIGIIASIAGNPKDGAKSVASTSGNNSVTQAPTYTAYDVSELMSDLKTNAMKAQEKYKKADVTLTGRLNNIDSSGKYISIVPVDDQFAIIGVQCYIKNDEQKNKIMNMKVGDTVVLNGKIKDVGEVLGYSLDIDSIN